VATPVEMPQMGESVVEGTILNWLKKEGDSVDVDDALVEVSTDKVDTEIPSPVAGKLTKILVQEGETVDVGTPLCEIDEGGASAKPSTADEKTEKADEKPAPPPEETQPATTEAPPKPERDEEPRAPERPAAAAPVPERPAAAAPEGAAAEVPAGQILSPLVRRLAREHNVDPSQIRGTGTGGRVTKEDVMAFVERGDGQRAAPAAAPAAAAQRPAAAQAPARAAPPAAREAAGDRTTTEPLTHIRKRIAEHMHRSLQTSARAWNAIEVDMEDPRRHVSTMSETTGRSRASVARGH